MPQALAQFEEEEAGTSRGSLGRRTRFGTPLKTSR